MKMKQQTIPREREKKSKVITGDGNETEKDCIQKYSLKDTEIKVNKTV